MNALESVVTDTLRRQFKQKERHALYTVSGNFRAVKIILRIFIYLRQFRDVQDRMYFCRMYMWKVILRITVRDLNSSFNTALLSRQKSRQCCIVVVRDMRFEVSRTEFCFTAQLLTII